MKVKRETVQQLIKQIDPEGVAVRTSRKFKRRIYYVSGPNFIWHIDGYDKLKPYGFFNLQLRFDLKAGERLKSSA